MSFVDCELHLVFFIISFSGGFFTFLRECGICYFINTWKESGSMDAHFTASGYIVNKDRTKVLMVFHKKLNVWVIPGGHLELNETPEAGAQREVFEETGIRATIIDSACQDLGLSGDKEQQMKTPYTMLSELIPGKGDKPAHIHMDFIYLGYVDEDESLVGQEAEVSDVKWMSFDEVMAVETFDSVKKITRAIVDGGGFDKVA